MPLVSFDQLPDEARLWIFGTSDILDEAAASAMLHDVDEWLEQWQAHGFPLTCAREWRDDHFLVVGVDQRMEGASGCSIDALYRILMQVERTTNTSLLAGGRVFYRASDGSVSCVDRSTFVARARAGAIGGETAVFDTTVTTAGVYRSAFERPLSESWHSQLVSA